MKYSNKCEKCGQESAFTESEIKSLSQSEQLLCAKEDLDFANMVKITCNHCNTSILIPRKNLPLLNDAPQADMPDLTGQQLAALCPKLKDIMNKAFDTPGPLFNEARKLIIESWLANFVANIESAVAALTTGRDSNGNPISMEQVTDGVDQMCKEYRKGLHRLEDVCGPRVCQNFETIMVEATSPVLKYKQSEITHGQNKRKPKPDLEFSQSATRNASLLWARDNTVIQVKQPLELKEKLEKAALLLDRGSLGSEKALGAIGCLALIGGGAIGFCICYLITIRSDNSFSAGWSFLGTVIGAIILLIMITFIHSVLNPGISGVKKAIEKICHETELSKADLLEYLPLRLQNAPDVLEFLDEQALKKGIEQRCTEIEMLVNTSLTQAHGVNKDAISEAVSQGKEVSLEQNIVLTDTRSDTLRIQLVSAVGEAIAKERQQLIAERMRRAGSIMMNSIGSTANVNTALQQAIAQANAQMTEQFTRFYLIYGLLGGAMLPFLKGWRWEDAIDIIMGWPGEFYPSIGLAVFLQGYWQDNSVSDISPQMMASRTMCWVYASPNKWETIKQLLEDTTFHQSGFKKGKIDNHALKQYWRKFATEISRQATILLLRKEHKDSAEIVRQYCAKV